MAELPDRSGDPVAEIARLRQAPGKNLALGGGPRLAQWFLSLGLVDDLRLVMYPSLVGSGKPMFSVRADPDSPRDGVPLGAPGRVDFRLREARPLRHDALLLHYEAAR